MNANPETDPRDEIIAALREEGAKATKLAAHPDDQRIKVEVRVGGPRSMGGTSARTTLGGRNGPPVPPDASRIPDLVDALRDKAKGRYDEARQRIAEWAEYVRECEEGA